MITKRNLQKALVVIAALPLLLSCAQSYPGLEYDEGDHIHNEEAYDKTPIMLFVNEQSFFSVTATRGTDAFDSELKTHNIKMKNTKIYVYAFRNGKDVHGPFAEPVDFTKSAYSDRANDPDHQDCLLDGIDYNMGLEMVMPTMEDKFMTGALRPTEREKQDLYYSSTYQDVGFNFFAYYIDDIKIDANNTKREKDKIYYDIEIDGSQDILCGSAPQLTKEVLQAKKVYETLSKEDRDKILAIDGYSTFAAHREVHPEVEMSHQLTRLKFFAYPGDKNADDIIITGVSVNTPYKGRMTVAARSLDEVGTDFTVSEEKKELFLHEEPEVGEGDILLPSKELGEYTFKYDPEAKDKNGNVNPIWQNQQPTRLGESLMIPPTDSIELKIYYKQNIYVGLDNDYSDGVRDGMEYRNLQTVYKVDAPMNDDTGRCYFEKGYSYPLHIAVYGLQKIDVIVYIPSWNEGGGIEVDPDQGDYQ